MPIVMAFAILSLPLDEIFATRIEYEEEVRTEIEHNENLADEPEISGETSVDNKDN